ncbi:hypothetical protein CK203_049340 [Vitis vinifera]|uniref:Uncharacterized protein n=1 Tax=Vitis vinifera TaxID=29760 RepID=A0A438FVN9_VITVI|nr:hypothetical protein CK203_049340 [Vitis vinifera]
MINTGEAKNRGSRAVQAIDLHISEEHGSHSITRHFWRYMSATQESIASNGARFGVETKKLWPFEDDCAKLNGNVAAVPHFATVGHLLHPYPSQYQASEPHFFAPLCLSSLEQSESYPCAGPLDAPAHLLDSAPQRRYHTRRAAATPVAPTQIPPRSPPTKKANTSESGESSRAPRDSQSQPPPTRRPILASSPIEGNSDCRSRAFHVEAYFDHSIFATAA